MNLVGFNLLRASCCEEPPWKGLGRKNKVPWWQSARSVNYAWGDLSVLWTPARATLFAFCQRISLPETSRNKSAQEIDADPCHSYSRLLLAPFPHFSRSFPSYTPPPACSPAFPPPRHSSTRFAFRGGCGATTGHTIPHRGSKKTCGGVKSLFSSFSSNFLFSDIWFQNESRFAFWGGCGATTGHNVLHLGSKKLAGAWKPFCSLFSSNFSSFFLKRCFPHAN